MTKSRGVATALLPHLFTLVVRGIVSIKVLGIQIVLRNTKGISEALIMHDLTGAKKFDWLPHIRIVAQSQNVVIRGSRLLFCYYHVFATKLSLAKVRKILILQGVTAPSARSKRQAVCPSGFDCARPCHSEWSEAESNRSVAEARQRNLGRATLKMTRGIRNSSEFQWVRFVSPEYAFRP